ncbi:hypothetical protein GGP77_001681 [Salinibacter ruber]|uniref:glycoside hydrolase family 55 protein n=1 Tax=Salinibacter ruber TaxID=146919 RepID=UPI0021678D50|nr:glycoside hydrolase family 55 protein [Salinibacter ruber]MCS3667452.1 hypothetical protein [Salinibacter ruber]
MSTETRTQLKNSIDTQLPDGSAVKIAKVRQEMKDIIDTAAPVQNLTDLRNYGGSAGHVVAVGGDQGGLFVARDSDPFGNGDDGAVALQASDGTWWVRRGTLKGKPLDAQEMGMRGDGNTDDTSAFRDAIAAAQEMGRPLYLPSGEYRITDTIEVDNNVHIFADGVQPGRWSYNDLKPDTILLHEQTSGPLFFVATTPDTEGGSGHQILEGPMLEGFGVRPGPNVTAFNTGRAFDFDASQDNNSNRKQIFSPVLRRISVKRTGRDGIRFFGDVLDARIINCSITKPEKDALRQETAVQSAGTGHPETTQIQHSYFTTTDDQVSIHNVGGPDSGSILMVGGGVTGQGNGVVTGRGFQCFGTRIESGASSANFTVGVIIDGPECELHPEKITAYNTGVQIKASDYRGHIPLLKADDTAIKELSGNDTWGKISVGKIQAPTRLDAQEGKVDFQPPFQTGDTPSRPAPDLRAPGTRYLDTDLGHMIHWNGSDWVDGSGNVV